MAGNRGPAGGGMTVDLSVSPGDHQVRVMEVLLERVEQLESRVVDGRLSAHQPLAGEAESFADGGGI
jgi:hypothetical protein